MKIKELTDIPLSTMPPVNVRPFGYLKQTSSQKNPPHGWAFYFNDGEVPIFTAQQMDQFRQKEDRAESDMRLAYRLLQRVLSCGLNEEPRGSGFTPSRQERLASELARDIMNFVSKHAALVRGENIT